MSRVISIVLLIAAGTVLLCIATYRPTWLSDDNSFMQEFIGVNYLSILGVILAITLASLSQLHLALGRIKDKMTIDQFNVVKREIRSSAVFLICLFIIAIALVILKPLIVTGVTGAALINGSCLLVLYFYILILADITLSVFELPV